MLSVLQITVYCYLKIVSLSYTPHQRLKIRSLVWCHVSVWERQLRVSFLHLVHLVGSFEDERLGPITSFPTFGSVIVVPVSPPFITILPTLNGQVSDILCEATQRRRSLLEVDYSTGDGTEACSTCPPTSFVPLAEGGNDSCQIRQESNTIWRH